MVYLPLPPELEREDEVLEAERQLSQYLSSRQASHGAGQAPLRHLLSQRLTALAEQILRQEQDLEELRRRASAVPPEVALLREENGRLASKSHSFLEAAAELSAQQGSLEEAKAEVREEVESLQVERDALAKKLDEQVTKEAEAKGLQESCLRALDLERHRSQDLSKTLSAALAQRRAALEDVEKRAKRAEREVGSLETSLAAAQAEHTCAESTGQAEAARRQQRAQLLESQQQQQSSEEAQEAELRQRLQQARAEAKELEVHAENFAQQLADSEQKAEESERKATAVAKELLETSRSIARLRQELGHLQGAGLQQLLQSAQQDMGALNQRLRPERQQPQEESALKEALRNAWAHEAKDRKATEEKLQGAEELWQGLREQLQSLGSVARRCRNEVPGMRLAPPGDEVWADPSAVPGRPKCPETRRPWNPP
ncbi:unnamed protein product [Effrenium voratum]|uniref:Uncharacterized protein n=1 Tax=Effrenium voratum TaxID=2562239 RepID=A0AA36JDB8_9DINO|nr:unnamed protein product [Effrenium voratum]CAJ1458658.1 unnamed protein product [Effrenium voratum]